MSAGYDVEFEMDVLASSLKDSKFLSRAAPILRRHNFSSKSHAWVWTNLEHYWTEYRERVTPSILLAQIDHDFKKPEQVEHMQDVLKALYGRKVAAPKSALKFIGDYYKMAVMRETASKVLDGMDDRDLDKASEALNQGAVDMRGAEGLRETTAWGDGVKGRLGRYKSAQTHAGPVFRTPFPSLNRVFNGGMKPGKMGIILGNTGVGKSCLAVDLGFNALVHDRAVVIHITTEEMLEEAEIRYDARFSEIARDKLEDGKLTDAEAEMLEARFKRSAKVMARLFIEQLPPGSKVTLIQPIVEQVREQFPDEPLLLIFDSPYHTTWKRQYEAYRHEIKAIFDYLASLITDPEYAPMAMWATDHARRQDAGRNPGAESGAESYDKNRTTGVVIGLREGEADINETEKTIEVNVAKNRLGKIKRMIIYSKANTAICKFREVAYDDDQDDDDGDS